MASLFHAATNTWTQIFPIDHADSSVFWLYTVVVPLAALLVVIGSGPAHLSRKLVAELPIVPEAALERKYA